MLKRPFIYQLDDMLPFSEAVLLLDFWAEQDDWDGHDEQSEKWRALSAQFKDSLARGLNGHIYHPEIATRLESEAGAWSDFIVQGFRPEALRV